MESKRQNKYLYYIYKRNIRNIYIKIAFQSGILNTKHSEWNLFYVVITIRAVCGCSVCVCVCVRVCWMGDGQSGKRCARTVREIEFLRTARLRLSIGLRSSWYASVCTIAQHRTQGCDVAFAPDRRYTSNERAPHTGQDVCVSCVSACPIQQRRCRATWHIPFQSHSNSPTVVSSNAVRHRTSLRRIMKKHVTKPSLVGRGNRRTQPGSHTKGVSCFAFSKSDVRACGIVVTRKAFRDASPRQFNRIHTHTHRERQTKIFPHIYGVQPCAVWRCIFHAPPYTCTYIYSKQNH